MCYDDKIYKTFYWFPINIDINSSHFVGSANLLNVCGNVVGKLLLKTSANVSNGLALVEDFSFLFNDGSMNFSIGFNEFRFAHIRDGNYGVVSNKSGVYTDSNSIKYYFDFDSECNLWKITFKFEY